MAAAQTGLKFIALMSMAIAAEAHSPETVWDDPGRDAWPGSLTEAVLALADCGAPYAAVAQLAYRAHRGACEEGEVRDGDTFDLMLSAHGCLRNVVARIPAPGWEGKSRKTLQCHDGAGNWLIIPEACNNGSYVYRPPVVPPPADVGIPALPGGGAWWPGMIPGAFGGGVAGFPGFPGFPILAGAAVPIGGEIIAPAGAIVALSGAGSAAIVSGANAPALVTSIQTMAAPSAISAGLPITPVPGAAVMSEMPNAIPVDEPWCVPLFTLAAIGVAVLKYRSTLGVQMRLNRLVTGGSLHDPTARAFVQPRPVWRLALGALLQLIGLGVAVSIIAYALMTAD